MMSYSWCVNEFHFGPAHTRILWPVHKIPTIVARGIISQNLIINMSHVIEYKLEKDSKRNAANDPMWCFGMHLKCRHGTICNRQQLVTQIFEIVLLTLRSGSVLIDFFMGHSFLWHFEYGCACRGDMTTENTMKCRYYFILSIEMLNKLSSHRMPWVHRGIRLSICYPSFHSTSCAMQRTQRKTVTRLSQTLQSQYPKRYFNVSFFSVRFRKKRLKINYVRRFNIDFQKMNQSNGKIKWDWTMHASKWQRQKKRRCNGRCSRVRRASHK